MSFHGIHVWMRVPGCRSTVGWRCGVKPGGAIYGLKTSWPCLRVLEPRSRLRQTIESSLRLLKAKFGAVFYVPGNHEPGALFDRGSS